MIASIPAKSGAAKLVPPAVVRFLELVSRNPCEQLPVIPVKPISLEQKRYGALAGEGFNEMSGTKRIVPEGMPGTPVCQKGLEVSALTPPPLAEMVTVVVVPLVEAKSSFQTCSGI